MEDITPVGLEAGITEPAFGDEGVGVFKVPSGAECGVLGDGDAGLYRADQWLDWMQLSD